jgi:hypothetical protein
MSQAGIAWSLPPRIAEPQFQQCATAWQWEQFRWSSMTYLNVLTSNHASS